VTKPRLKDADLQQAVDAVAAHGNQSAASRALGIVRETFVRRYWVAVNRGFKPQVQALIAGERAAPTDGYGVSKVTTTFDKDGEIEKQWVGLSVKDAKSREMGEDAPMPEGQILKGLSTLYDGNGRITQQWVKTKTDLEAQLQASLEAIRSVFEEVTPLDPIAAPEHCNSRLLTVYPIGDHHVGMKAWGEETGTDYDMKIAERLLTSAAAHLVEVSPPSETALVINLGDLYHVDNLKNQTSRSGNVLDVDGRYAAMIRAGVKVMRVVIEKALAKHTQVKVICVIGNHDDVGAMWLQLALSLFYENNPRVTVETKPGKFHYHQHGKVLIGTTHGDTGKPEKLSGVMAADMPQMWGETAFRYWFTGHVHSRKVIEFPGVMWETFRTLAPNDAYSAGAAYRSGRDMTSIVMHEQHGEVARHRFDVSMMDAA
jgi:hypothetical protein